MARETTSFRSAERELHGTILTPDSPTGVAALLIHGYKTSSQTLKHYAKPLVREGIVCLTFDLSGHGSSGGNLDDLTVNDHVNDTVTAFDQLQSRTGVDPGRIGVIGMSYGGYLAALLLARRNPNSLLLRAAPLYPDHLRHRPRHTYNDHEALHTQPDPNNAALRSLQSFGGNVLLVAMEDDSVVTPDITGAYREAKPDSGYRVIEGAGHSLNSETKPVFQGIALEWAAEL